MTAIIHLRKLTTITAGSALAILTAATVTSSTASATNQPAAGAADTQSQPHVQVLRLVDQVDPSTNVDIDLGVRGPSVGDQQVFRDRLLRSGRRVGFIAGVAQIIVRTETTLVAQVVSTATLPDGTLTTQMAFVEVLADGPPSVLKSAITGGTGAYRNARGECEAHFINNSDDANVTCRVISG